MQKGRTQNKGHINKQKGPTHNKGHLTKQKGRTHNKGYLTMQTGRTSDKGHINIQKKARGKETTRKTKTRWIDNIKMDLVEIGIDSVDWIDLALDRYRWRALVNAVMNLRVP
jgi:hypothetical protein